MADSCSGSKGAMLLEVLVTIGLFAASVAVFSNEQAHLIRTHAALKRKQQELSYIKQTTELLPMLIAGGESRRLAKKWLEQIEPPFKISCSALKQVSGDARAYQYYVCKLKNPDSGLLRQHVYNTVNLWGG